MKKIIALFTPPYFIFVASMLAMTTSCASIVSNSTYPVSVSSSPQGATVTITNTTGQIVYTGTTPATVVLTASSGFASSERYSIEFKKDGHSSQTMVVNANIDGWFFGNFLIGGIIGMAIDASTGAMWKLPPHMTAALTESTASLILKHQAGELRIVFADDVTLAGSI